MTKGCQEAGFKRELDVLATKSIGIIAFLPPNSRPGLSADPSDLKSRLQFPSMTADGVRIHGNAA